MNYNQPFANDEQANTEQPNRGVRLCSVLFGSCSGMFGFVRTLVRSFGCSGCVIRKQLCWLAFGDPSLLRLGSISRGIYAPKGVLKICEQAPIFNLAFCTFGVRPLLRSVQSQRSALFAPLFVRSVVWSMHFCSDIDHCGKNIFAIRENYCYLCTLICAYTHTRHTRERGNYVREVS